MQLRKRGITIVMITHSMRLVEEYADRVIVMNQGLTTFDGHPRDLFRRPDIMEQASLKVTTLQTLVNELGNRGKLITTQIRSIDDFLDALGPI
jgi:ABC-type multidrug transport system ATPase subunit